MIGVALIFFREILEVALVFAVLLAATRGVARRAQTAWTGVALGVAASAVIAFFAEAISSAAAGVGQEVLNAAILSLAVALITWHVVWMSRHGRQMAKQFKQIGESVLKGDRPPMMIAVVMALAVLREGSEIILFTYGMLVQGTAIGEAALGGVLGLVAGVAAGALFYLGLLKVSPGRIFGVTSGLLILLAAGMASQAVGFLSAAGWVPELVSPLWNTSGWISEGSLLGKILNSLLGYSERPSGAQVLAYLLTLGAIIMLLKKFGEKKSSTLTLAMLFFGAGILFHSDAFAFPKVYSPAIEKGELEIEALGSVTFDDRDAYDDKQDQRYALGYGVTDWWATEVYTIFKKPADADYEFESIEWENRFMPFQPGQNWMDIGFYFAYEFNVEDEPAADKFEGKLLLEKQLDPFVHDVNLILEKEVNGDSGVEEEELEGGISYSGRYRFRKEFEPGFEIHHEFGVFDENLSFDEQSMQLGPVIYGKIGPVKYDVGYLFGVTEGAPDGELKWIVEYEARF